MRIKIRLSKKKLQKRAHAAELPAVRKAVAPSVVRVYFPARGFACTYYNDKFDLRRGDIVYVDGKLEGLRGFVTEVSYNFKIKLSEYKRVIAQASTEVKGKFYTAGEQLITFSPETLPYKKAAAWFLPPADPDETYVRGRKKGETFRLEKLTEQMNALVVNCGREIRMEDKVLCLELAGTRGRAVVEGRKPYEVEFTYQNGEIGGLLCTCYEVSACKHEAAALLQLRELLQIIEKQYAEQFEQSGYFAAVRKTTLLEYAVDNRETIGFTLE